MSNVDIKKAIELIKEELDRLNDNSVRDHRRLIEFAKTLLRTAQALDILSREQEDIKNKIFELFAQVTSQNERIQNLEKE